MIEIKREMIVTKLFEGVTPEMRAKIAEEMCRQLDLQFRLPLVPIQPPEDYEGTLRFPQRVLTKADIVCERVKVNKAGGGKR